MSDIDSVWYEKGNGILNTAILMVNFLFIKIDE